MNRTNSAYPMLWTKVWVWVTVGLISCLSVSWLFYNKIYATKLQVFRILEYLKNFNLNPQLADIGSDWRVTSLRVLEDTASCFLSMFQWLDHCEWMWIILWNWSADHDVFLRLVIAIKIFLASPKRIFGRKCSLNSCSERFNNTLPSILSSSNNFA
jgi:hypothetical protein